MLRGTTACPWHTRALLESNQPHAPCTQMDQTARETHSLSCWLKNEGKIPLAASPAPQRCSVPALPFQPPCLILLFVLSLSFSSLLWGCCFSPAHPPWHLCQLSCHLLRSGLPASQLRMLLLAPRCLLASWQASRSADGTGPFPSFAIQLLPWLPPEPPAVPAL